ncbi:MAG: hypothetical protein ACC655_01835, partial [Rhodothermia bacterium]
MIGCLYISDFPAWARQSQHPEWRAIAVYRRGEIIARSRLLEQRGLHVGESLDRARTVFPNARFFKQDQPFEQAVWEGVIERINETTPFLAPVDHGWALFRPHSFSEACELSGSLLARVGLGPNRSVARLSALRSASGSVLQIKQDAVDRFLTSTKVEILTGLGFEHALVERLLLFGLTTLASVKRLTRRHLDAQFGDAGIALHSLLHPDARSEQVPLYVPPPTISESFDLEGAPLEWLPTNHLLERLSRQAARRLGNRLCRRITLQIETSMGNIKNDRRGHGQAEKSVAQRILKKPTANPGEIFRAASFLLNQLVENTPTPTPTPTTSGQAESGQAESGHTADE